MKAMIFAAGMGTRLKPFTLRHPKALVPVGGVAMLERVIMRLRDTGISDIVVNVHHFAGQITDFLKANDNFGLNIAISDESDMLLDTGGGILKARHLLDDGSGQPFVIHNADILTDSSLVRMLDTHRQCKADVTLLVRERPSDRHLYFDADMRLRGWSDDRNGATRPEGFVPDPAMQKLSFGGVHIMSPSVFDALQAYSDIHGPVFSITPFYTDMADRIGIYGYRQNSVYQWFDIGDNAKLAAAEASIS